MTTYPDFQTFEKFYLEGKTQLLTSWVSSDLETPVSAYLKLCNDRPYSFLLESVEGGSSLGRYSAIGLDPDIIWSCEGNENFLETKNAKSKQISSPLDTLRSLLKNSRIDIVPELCPPMAASGLFGMMGYDMIRLIENIPDSNPDELQIPDGVMLRPTIMVIFDNVKSRLCVSTPVYEHTGTCEHKASQIYNKAIGRIQSTLDVLNTPIPKNRLKVKTNQTLPLNVTANMATQEFHGIVNKSKEYILAGDIFQAVFSQRFSFSYELPAFELYRSLRQLNPSPFLFYFNFGKFQLVGSSPEILVRVRNDIVTIRPIAGTRKRGKNAMEDKLLADDLLSDPKERAEHLMLLDLGRNDVGRVAETGSVKVTDQFKIEYYSHVMHIVSNVEGRLKSSLDTLDALFAGFPAGTVSGAPKIRAMEIIDELEGVKRKFYAGCVGYISGSREMDTCIALRTALVKDGKVYVQAGAGIVADSTPELEYQETVNKARAIIQAAEESIVQANPHAGRPA